MNRAFRNITDKYRPGNILCHLPVVVRSRTVGIVRKHFNLDQTHALTRTNRELQFEYMLAQVEYHLLGGRYKICNEYSFVSMSGPLSKLRTIFCYLLSRPRSRSPKKFICINDDIDAMYLKVAGEKEQFKSLIADFMESLVQNKATMSNVDNTCDPELHWLL